jgi:hypothetical protein
VNDNNIPDTKIARQHRFNEFMPVWLYLGPLVVLVCLQASYYAYEAVNVLDLLNNPNRHFYEFAVMFPLATAVASVVALISHVLSYPLLIACAFLLTRWLDRVPFAVLLATTPLLGLLTWYGYDHFIPDYHWYTDDRRPYEHGLTLERFLKSWALDFAVVLGYWWPIRNYRLSAQVPS